LQQQFDHIQHTFERRRDLVGVDFVKLNNRQEQLEHERNDCLSQQWTTDSSTKYAEVLFAAAIHNRIQDTLERCRDLVGTYSTSIIIITLSAGIIFINPNGEDQKLDQERDQDIPCTVDCFLRFSRVMSLLLPPQEIAKKIRDGTLAR